MKKYFVLLVCALALCGVSSGAKTLLERMTIHSQRLDQLVAEGHVMTNEATHLLDALADDFARAQMYPTAEEAVRTSAKIRANIFGKESQAYAYSLCRIAGMPYTNRRPTAPARRRRRALHSGRFPRADTRNIGCVAPLTGESHGSDLLHRREIIRNFAVPANATSR